MRRNVYVGDELHRRMQSLEPQPNWSEIACSAFEREIERRDGASQDTAPSATITVRHDPDTGAWRVKVLP